jgi:hypothetical protein
MGAKSSGPIGCLVPGCNGGKGLFGMSATMLYQCCGISDSSSRIFFCGMFVYLKIDYFISAIRLEKVVINRVQQINYLKKIIGSGI